MAQDESDRKQSFTHTIINVFFMVAEQRCSTTSNEMAEYMQRVREQSSELLIEEWNLLSLTYKNAVGSRRAAWRVIISTEQKEKFKGKEELVLHAREHVAKHP